MFDIKIHLNGNLGMFFVVKFKHEYVKDFNKTTEDIVKMINEFELDEIKVLKDTDDTTITAKADEYIAIGELGILMIDVESLIKKERR